MIVELPGGRIDVLHREIVAGSVRTPLREKEAALLEALVRAAGEVVEREQLERGVFGYGASVSTRTVDTTVRRLRKALDAVGARDLVQTSYGEGYRWIGPPPGRRSRVGIRGRSALLEQAVQWLEGDQGLLVICGPGGMGKTLLARELAARVERSCWVDLTQVQAPDEAVLRVSEVVGTSADAIGPALQLASTLLVLDDCDVLDPAMGHVVAGWTREGARVVVTRRTPLSWPGARTLRLDALSLADASELWSAHDGDPAAGEAIWGRTGGHPLSILLASRLARGLDVNRLLALPGLEARLVDPGQPNVRHRSLAELYRSAVERLSDRERWLLALLAHPPEDVSVAFVTWLAAERAWIPQALVVLRDAGLVVEQHDGLRVHGIYRGFIQEGREPVLQGEQTSLWVRWVRERAEAWLSERQPLPPVSTVRHAMEAALTAGLREHAGVLLYALTQHAHLTARPQEPQRAGLAALDAVGGASPWAELTEGLLAASEHPVVPSRADRAIEATSGTPWHWQAYVLRARLAAYVGDGPGVQADIDAAEHLAAARGESELVRAWLDASELLSFVSDDEALLRLERARHLLERLDHDEILRWHRVAAVIHGLLLQPRAHLEVTTAGLALADGRDAAAHAAAACQLGSARWNNGDLAGAIEATEAAVRMSVGARASVRVMCSNNLCALHQERMDWERMRGDVAACLARAGADRRAQELARRLEAEALRLLGETPVHVPPDATAVRLATTDPGWFLWQAQCGEAEQAVAAAEAVLLPLGAPKARAPRLRQLLVLATLYLAVERPRDALGVFAHVLSVLPDVSPYAVPTQAAQAAARSLTGDATAVRWDRGQEACSPLQQLETDLWRCVLHREPDRLARLHRLHQPKPRSELGWRFDVARRLSQTR